MLKNNKIILAIICALLLGGCGFLDDVKEMISDTNTNTDGASKDSVEEQEKKKEAGNKAEVEEESKKEVANEEDNDSLSPEMKEFINSIGMLISAELEEVSKEEVFEAIMERMQGEGQMDFPEDELMEIVDGLFVSEIPADFPFPVIPHTTFINLSFFPEKGGKEYWSGRFTFDQSLEDAIVFYEEEFKKLNFEMESDDTLGLGDYILTVKGNLNGKSYSGGLMFEGNFATYTFEEE